RRARMLHKKFKHWNRGSLTLLPMKCPFNKAPSASLHTLNSVLPTSEFYNINNGLPDNAAVGSLSLGIPGKVAKSCEEQSGVSTTAHQHSNSACRLGVCAGGQKIHVSLQKRRSSVLKEISSQVLDKWQLRQHRLLYVVTKSSSHGLQKLPMNKRNSPLTPDAIETPFADVTSPEHTHAAQRRLRTITPNVYRQEKQPTMHHQQTIAPNVYQQKKQTTHQQQTNDTHIQVPQPDRQQQCLSYAETARTSDPKNTRPRYETPI
ncbi:hypothetical protein Tco_0097301, partial [Tanacetum coccineum]